MPTDRDLIARGMTPLTPDEVRTLQDYRGLVADLNECALAKRNKITVNIGRPAEEALGDITRDEIKSLAADFRRLGWNNEPSGATFNHVRNLIARHASEAGTAEAETLLEWFKELKSVRAHLLKRARVLGWIIQQPDGSTVEITPEELLDIFINGGVFHSDREMRDRWNALGGWKSAMLLTNVVLSMWDFLELFRALDTFVGTVLEIDRVLPGSDSQSSGPATSVRT
jgi:hypothetical protein